MGGAWESSFFSRLLFAMFLNAIICASVGVSLTSRWSWHAMPLVYVPANPITSWCLDLGRHLLLHLPHLCNMPPACLPANQPASRLQSGHLHLFVCMHILRWQLGRLAGSILRCKSNIWLSGFKYCHRSWHSLESILFFVAVWRCFSMPGKQSKLWVPHCPRILSFSGLKNVSRVFTPKPASSKAYAVLLSAEAFYDTLLQV